MTWLVTESDLFLTESGPDQLVLECLPWGDESAILKAEAPVTRIVVGSPVLPSDFATFLDNLKEAGVWSIGQVVSAEVTLIRIESDSGGWVSLACNHANVSSSPLQAVHLRYLLERSNRKLAAAEHLLGELRSQLKDVRQFVARQLETARRLQSEASTDSPAGKRGAIREKLLSEVLNHLSARGHR